MSCPTFMFTNGAPIWKIRFAIVRPTHFSPSLPLEIHLGYMLFLRWISFYLWHAIIWNLSPYIAVSWIDFHSSFMRRDIVVDQGHKWELLTRTRNLVPVLIITASLGAPPPRRNPQPVDFLGTSITTNNITPLPHLLSDWNNLLFRSLRPTVHFTRKAKQTLKHRWFFRLF